jgi:hypothetical protein
MPARAPVAGQVAWISKRSTEIYCKIDAVWALFFLLTALAWAQPAGALKPVFPDDTQDPKQAGGAQLLEAACPGHVVAGKSVECKIVCPDLTDFKGAEQEWSLDRVTRGHFRSPQSDDAVLSMSGCESHAFNFGGTILLTRQSGKWTMLWYKGGVPTKNFHRVKLQSGREILICLGEYGGQGNVWTDLYVEDLLAPVSALMSGKGKIIFEVFDNTATCGLNPEDESKTFPLTRHYVERVQFQSATDGTFRGLSVFGRHGERSMTVAQVNACTDEQIPGRPHRGLDFRPPTKPYRVDFTFDGEHIVRVGGSPGAPK